MTDLGTIHLDSCTKRRLEMDVLAKLSLQFAAGLQKESQTYLMNHLLLLLSKPLLLESKLLLKHKSYTFYNIIVNENFFKISHVKCI